MTSQLSKIRVEYQPWQIRTLSLNNLNGQTDLQLCLIVQQVNMLGSRFGFWTVATGSNFTHEIVKYVTVTSDTCSVQNSQAWQHQHVKEPLWHVANGPQFKVHHDFVLGYTDVIVIWCATILTANLIGAKNIEYGVCEYVQSASEPWQLSQSHIFTIYRS